MPSHGPKRGCTGTTKTGGLCKAAPLTGRSVCIAHADKKTRENTRFGGSQPGAGRPPKPKAPDAARQLLEQHPEIVLRPLFRTLGYEVLVSDDGELSLVELEDGGAKLYGTAGRDGKINVSPHDDLAAMVGAAEKLLNRVYGRPKLQAEVTGADSGATRVGHGIDLKQLTPDELNVLDAIRARIDGCPRLHNAAALARAAPCSGSPATTARNPP